jgi:hypothetical protein
MSTTVAEDVDAEDRRRTFDVTVNDHPVRLRHKERTGAEIKRVAIRQGAELEQDFQLSVERRDGHFEVIGDEDEIKVRDDMTFIAVAGDDNS